MIKLFPVLLPILFQIIFSNNLFVSAVFLPFCRISPQNAKLEIDQRINRRCSHKENENNFNVLQGSRNIQVLKKLYLLVESGHLTNTSRLMIFVDEIFEKNRIYYYSPAEWAIYHDKLNVLDHFIKESLFRYAQAHHLGATLNGLLVTAIKSNHLEAFKLIRSNSKLFSIKRNSFLNLAAQHHVNEEFIHFLLDDCELVSELVDDAVTFLDYGTPPLLTAVKFNNSKAAIIFIERGANLSFPLQNIMSLNRKRLLSALLDYFKYFCSYKDSDGDGILHLAAKYSNDPEMINLVIEKCPNIIINELNDSGDTPLELCLESSNQNLQKVAEQLILHGTDIFSYSSNGFRSIDKIIKNRLKILLKFVLETQNENNSKMQRILSMICISKAWSLLDQVLLLRPEFFDLINFNEISFSDLLLENAHVAFKMAIQKGIFTLKDSTIHHIINSDSIDFIKVVLESGFDIKSVFSPSDFKKISDQISDEMYDLILSLIN